MVWQPEWRIDGELVPGPGGRDIEEALLLEETAGRGQSHVGGKRAVDDIDEMDAVPLQALGGVHSGQNEVVFVQVGWRGEVARRDGRVECQRGDVIDER